MCLLLKTTVEHSKPLCLYARQVLRLVGRSVRRARGGVILMSTTNSGGLL
jgi:hypothetical protein